MIKRRDKHKQMVRSRLNSLTCVRYPATAGATTPIMLAAQLVIPSRVPAKLEAMSRWTHLHRDEIILKLAVSQLVENSHESCILGTVDSDSKNKKDNDEEGVATTVAGGRDEDGREVDAHAVEELPHQSPIKPRRDRVVR